MLLRNAHYAQLDTHTHTHTHNAQLQLQLPLEPKPTQVVLQIGGYGQLLRVDVWYGGRRYNAKPPPKTTRAAGQNIALALHTNHHMEKVSTAAAHIGLGPCTASWKTAWAVCCLLSTFGFRAHRIDLFPCAPLNCSPGGAPHLRCMGHLLLHTSGLHQCFFCTHPATCKPGPCRLGSCEQLEKLLLRPLSDQTLSSCTAICPCIPKQRFLVGFAGCPQRPYQRGY
jgi:hypothetical protein